MADLNEYIVKAGDTLSGIAAQLGTTVAELVRLNKITDPDYIVVGQELRTSGEPVSSSTNNSNRATIGVFGLQSNTESTLYATWSWTKENTDSYQVRWYYDTGNVDSKGYTLWFVGTDTTVKEKQATYSAPSNAKRVRFMVKPISQIKTVKGSQTSYWTAEWSTEKIYNFDDNPPKAPSTPDVTLEGFRLTSVLNNVSLNAKTIEFQVVVREGTAFKTFATSTTTIQYASDADEASLINGYARYACALKPDGEYQVRARSVRDGLYSDWSAYSGSYFTAPSAPSGITKLYATSETSVYLEWPKVQNAKTYEIEYATETRYFDGSDAVTSKSGIESTHYEITGLQTGDEYFFRVRAIRDSQNSGWSEIKSVTIGKEPAAPTTWSSTTTAIVGEPLTLYWVHNAEDGSSQTYAELQIAVDGDILSYTVKNTDDEDEKDKTSLYVVDTTDYPEGTKLLWRVRTAGITTTYGDWSVQRTIDIYAPPTVELEMTDVDGNSISTLTAFPFYISALAGPKTQEPIGYHLSIVSNETYETVDSVGNMVVVSSGSEVYSRHFNTNDPLAAVISANNVDLQNNVKYTITCTASMNSGLTGEASLDFTVAWADEEYVPNAEISIDQSTLSAVIRPYCEDADGNMIEDVLLSVYRREFDGDFTEIVSGVENLIGTHVSDPHPALDYARYRIVTVSKTTGAVSYYDVPAYPVGGNAVIIQWDEVWSNFDSDSADALQQPVWAGAMLRLPYNIDVSDSNRPDVQLVEYIGREHPTSYYGTHVGQTSTWNVEIPKSDKETLYALRRLSRWMGDVYVREPSGSGYWANISVSFNQKHKAVTIPVTLNLTRVEGGV